MCPPDFFTVDYVINPWMAGHEDSLSIERAQQQWQVLRDTVSRFADVVTVDPDPALRELAIQVAAALGSPGR